MPIYEYRCTACGFQKEYLQKMGAALLTDCPECGKPSLAKMVTAAGFKLKGSGWYATDFKNPAKPKTEAAAQTAADDKATPKADDKPTAKAETKSAAESTAAKSEPAKTSTTSSAPAGTT